MTQEVAGRVGAARHRPSGEPMSRVASVVAILGVVSGCAPSELGPPEIRLDRTACAHCRMLVSELGFATAYQSPGRDGKVFDDAGCMLAHGLPAGAAVWFHDFVDLDWIAAEDAVFLHGSMIDTPMGGGVLAFRHRDVAERAREAYGGEVVSSFQELQGQLVARGAP